MPSSPVLKPDNAIIKAAGGIIWRSSPRGREILLVRRSRHGGDWTLPKGKLTADETWFDAALRETAEETGCQVDVNSFAGCYAYISGTSPKMVLFWHMELKEAGAIQDAGEVEELWWGTPDEALAKLSYESEKRFLSSCVHPEGP